MKEQKPADDLRMSGKKFDKIMRQALQVQPKSKKVTKAKLKGVPTMRKAARNGKRRNRP
jgi:hypothetical protein